MPQHEKIIGDQPFVKMLAASLKSEYSRYEELKKRGGFSAYDLMNETGLTFGQCQKKLQRMKLYSEKVIIPDKASRTRVYLPPGVKPPPK